MNINILQRKGEELYAAHRTDRNGMTNWYPSQAQAKAAIIGEMRPVSHSTYNSPGAAYKKRLAKRRKKAKVGRATRQYNYRRAKNRRR